MKRAGWNEVEARRVRERSIQCHECVRGGRGRETPRLRPHRRGAEIAEISAEFNATNAFVVEGDGKLRDCGLTAEAQRSQR